MRHLTACGQQTTRNNVRFVLPAVAQTRFKGLDGRRQDEDADGRGQGLANLTRTLPVDFEQYVSPGLQGFVDTIARRAIEIAVHLGPFEQRTGVAQGFELFDADEAVMLV